MQVTSAEFVTSAADARGVPRDVDQIALVGRSNVGKSTLINALLRQRLARTSAAAGKTRLLNFYRVTFDRFAPVKSLYLVDLPGYGYARGGQVTKEGFATLLESYFGGATRPAAVLHLVDARHPGLPQDVAAWDWIRSLTHASRPDDTRNAHDPPLAAAVVATKIDKLSRAERRRALETWTRQLNAPVLPVSAATGEGMTDLWTLIVRLLRPQLAVTPPRPTSEASAPSSAPSGPTGPSGRSEATGPSAPNGRSEASGPTADRDRSGRIARTDRTGRNGRNAGNAPSGPSAKADRTRRRRGRS